jgi:hypothetical protein
LLAICCESAGAAAGERTLVLRGGTDDDVTHGDTVRRLDGEGDGSGHRVRRDRDPVRLSRVWVFSSGFGMDSAKFVLTKPGDTTRKPSEMVRRAFFVPAYNRLERNNA